MRPHLRPPLPLTPEIQRDNRQRMLMAKLTQPGLNGYGLLSVEAKTSARSTQLAAPHGRQPLEPQHSLWPSGG